MRSYKGTDAVLVSAAALDTVDRAELERQFDRLLAANGASLARLAASYVNSTNDRDDLLQEIAMALWQALPAFRGECSERTFLFRIAQNRAITWLARSRQRTEQTGDELEVHDPAPDPESELVEGQRAARLRSAIHRLPVPLRQVIVLSLEGLGYREIAEVLGISETNVGARLTRARQLLRDALEKRK